MPLNRVHLELGRGPDFPQGSSDHGYDVVLPLNTEGHIDAGEWRTNKNRCSVRRFWNGEADERGHLVHRRGGTWAFHYDVQGDADEDEPGWKFDAHVFKVGEYVSLREQDGELRTFRVVSVRPA